MEKRNPAVRRKQISFHKFTRIKNSSHSQRVRVFLSLYPYTITTVIEAYLHGDHLYIHHGETKPDRKSLAARKVWKYGTYYYRYDINESVLIMGRHLG